MYDVHIARYLEVFPRNQLFVIDGEIFYKNPLPVLHELENFLGIAHEFRESMFGINDGFYCVGRSCKKEPTRTYDDYQPSSLETLHRLYAPYVANTMKLLNCTFQWKTVEYM